MKKQKFLTPEEVAEGLELSTRTVTNYLNDGLIRGFKVGRQWRIAEDDYIAFLKEMIEANLDQMVLFAMHLRKTGVHASTIIELDRRYI